MKHLFFAIFLLLTTVAFAQDPDKTVTLKASGSGTTQEQAKNNALRSAVEQAYGAFISSKTEVLNDQVVADEIVSVASGNIQAFKILEEQHTDSLDFCLLEAVVSISKLTSYAQSKGYAVEVKGGLFALNIKQQQINETAEIQSSYNLLLSAMEILRTSFVAEISVNNPIQNKQNPNEWIINTNIQSVSNSNIQVVFEMIERYLNAISMKESEIADYKSSGREVYYLRYAKASEETTFALRRMETLWAFERFKGHIHKFCSTFTINDGNNTIEYNHVITTLKDERYHARTLEPFKSFLSSFWCSDPDSPFNKKQTDLSGILPDSAVLSTDYQLIYSLEEIENIQEISIKLKPCLHNIKEHYLHPPLSYREPCCITSDAIDNFQSRDSIFDSCANLYYKSELLIDSTNLLLASNLNSTIISNDLRIISKVNGVDEGVYVANIVFFTDMYGNIPELEIEDMYFIPIDTVKAKSFKLGYRNCTRNYRALDLELAMIARDHEFAQSMGKQLPTVPKYLGDILLTRTNIDVNKKIEAEFKKQSNYIKNYPTMSRVGAKPNSISHVKRDQIVFAISK